MTLTKATNGTKEHIIVESSGKKFIIGWFGSDLYWVMLDYTPNNKFLVTEKTSELWEFLTTLFKENYFKNCTLTWSSEAGVDRADNKLKITKGENYFKIRFFQGKNDTLSKSTNTCPICFCLSGSKHQEIANEFSNFLHTILNSD